MDLTEGISTPVMIYIALVLSVPIRTTRSRSRSHRHTVAAGEGPGYRSENGNTGHGCRGAYDKIHCHLLRVRTFRLWHSLCGRLAWVRNGFALLHRIWFSRQQGIFISWPRLISVCAVFLPWPISWRWIFCLRWARGIFTAAKTLLPNFPRRTEYGQQGQRSYPDMKVALLNWHGQRSGYIRSCKGKDNDSHIRGHG
jgi:hypothetical protein